MGNKFITSIIIIIILLVTVFMYIVYLRQDSLVSATQNVEVTMKSTELGTVRTDATEALDKKAAVTNLALEIAEAYKGTPYDVKVDYAFLDKNGNVVSSNNSKDYESVQFRVSTLDEDGKTVAVSRQRLSLKEIE